MRVYRGYIFVSFLFFFLIYGEKAIAVEKEVRSKARDFKIYIEKETNKSIPKKPSSAFNKKVEANKILSNDREGKSLVSKKVSKPRMSSDDKEEPASFVTDREKQENSSLNDLSDKEEASPPPFILEGYSKKDKNTISETFAPDEAKNTEEKGLSLLKTSYSWIFDSKKTVQELAVTPIFYMSRTYGPNWGLRFFTFSPDNSGYYLSTSFTNQIFSSLFKWDVNYRQVLSKRQEVGAYGQFFNYFEPYFYKKGMDTKIDDELKLYTNKLQLNSRILFKEFYPFFYGVEVGGLFFNDKKPYIKDEAYFNKEFLVWLKLQGGYDSRDNWKDPKNGVHHQLSLNCVPLLNENNSYCLAEIDLRTYIPLSEQMPFLGESVLALRGFTGTSLIAPPSYSMTYRMGGSYVFRGFTSNRFRGDKIYFGQSELRVPLWKKTVSGVLFFELGETAEYNKSFAGFLWDFGFGFRFGIPPTYDIKLRMDLGFSTDKFDNSSYNFIVDFFQAF